ncbi:hypothetical protein [Shewanella psychropiezotolerans]|uniref:hypothetical protein n=1 Tax=Shewanella psychropiezotolerans TaxID=2593655 RepID=UPI001C8F7179|nr:hypothetical protein [Shewanella psychropiezotolerans]
MTTYAGRDTILINLDSPGTAVEACSSASTFAISSANTPEQRTRMWPLRLLGNVSQYPTVMLAVVNHGDPLKMSIEKSPD